jgi:hypothetical protein
VSEAHIRIGERETLESPAGRFDVVPIEVQHSGGTDVYRFGAQAPHVLVRWERYDGGRYDLQWVRRARYWEMHDPDDVGALGRP